MESTKEFIFETASIMAVDERNKLLNLLAKTPDNAVIAEVGCFVGGTTCEIAKAKPNGTIYAFEAFYWDGSDDHRKEKSDGNKFAYNLNGKHQKRAFFENISKHKNIIPIEGESPYSANEWYLKHKNNGSLTHWKDNLDFIFLDDGHDYPLVDANINFWYSNLKSGGIFCGHDINVSDVRKAVFDLINRHNLNLWIPDNLGMDIPCFYWFKKP